MKQFNNRTITPLISVVMPVYNAGEFLVNAVESILNQTYQNFELIIIDDASTDNSLKIIEKYKKQFPQKIKIIHMKKNLNCGGDLCANQGLKYAKGKYIARMDADDIAHPKRLEVQVEFLENNPDIFLVGSNAHVIDRNGKLIGEKLEPQTQEDIYKSYITFHPLIHPTCMIRRVYSSRIPQLSFWETTTSPESAILVDSGQARMTEVRNLYSFRYDIKYSANNDYYTFFKLLCQGEKFANLKDKLLYYRLHGKNDTLVKMRNKFLNTLKIRAKMVFKYGYRPTFKGVLVLFVQIAVGLTLPDILLKNIYLFSKGLVKFSNPFKSPAYSIK